MALPTVSVTGKLRAPNGDIISGGKLFLQLSSIKGHATDDVDGSVHYTIHGAKQVTSDVLGDVAFTLVPNDVITPADTYYDVIILGQALKHVEVWTVASSPDPVDIQAIPKSATAQTLQTPWTWTPITQAVLDTMPAGPQYAGRGYRVTGPPDKLVVCMQALDTTWSWVIVALGG